MNRSSSYSCNSFPCLYPSPFPYLSMVHHPTTSIPMSGVGGMGYWASDSLYSSPPALAPLAPMDTFHQFSSNIKIPQGIHPPNVQSQSMATSLPPATDTCTPSPPEFSMLAWEPAASQGEARKTDHHQLGQFDEANDQSSDSSMTVFDIAPVNDAEKPETAYYNYSEQMRNQLCKVCGELSAGFHNGAYVCEACKKFFHRHSSVERRITNPCPTGGHCHITKVSRGKCQSCRYLKCLKVGMYAKQTYAPEDFNISNIPCRVCDSPSSGFHFGCITCEGCKGFFRRTINSTKAFVCSGNGNCKISHKNRNSCKACRLNKCLENKMTKEGYRIGRQPNSVKDQIAREIRRSSYMREFISSGSGADAASSKADPGSPCLVDLVDCMDCMQPRSSDEENLPPPLLAVVKQEAIQDPSDEEYGAELMETDQLDNGPEDFFRSDSKIAHQVEIFREWAEQASRYLATPREDIKSRYGVEPANVEKSDSIEVVWSYMMNHFSMHTQHIVKFAKQIPGFNTIALRDRKTLICESMYPLMLLELSRDYNIAADEYNYFDFSRREREVIMHHFPSFERIKEHLRQSGPIIKPLNLDNFELGLLAVMEIFKNYRGLDDKVPSARLFLLAQVTLQNYAKKKHRESILEIRQQLSDMLDEMNQQHHDIIAQLKASKSHLEFPDLYVEMFSLESQEISTLDEDRSQL